jgi:assimilatory nitrate reductase catalytic subunit
MSRTGTLGRLFGQAPEATIELHPQELERRRFADGELLRVRSRRGEIVLPARGSDTLAPGQAFVAMHWGEEFVSGGAADGQALAGVNALTSGTFCPQSKQPELKHAAVRLERAELPWRVLAVAWLPAADALAVRERLRPLLRRFAYASCVPFGREPDAEVGLLFRAAAAAAPDDDTLLATIEAEFGLLGSPSEPVLRYADAKRGQRRAMRLSHAAAGSPLAAFLLAGDTRAEAWVLPLLQQREPAQAFGRALLAASAKPPVAVVSRGKQVCSCLDVTEPQIDAALARMTGSPDERLAALQGELRCGTQCGSCLPVLRARVRQPATPAATPAAPALASP